MYSSGDIAQHVYNYIFLHLSVYSVNMLAEKIVEILKVLSTSVLIHNNKLKFIYIRRLLRNYSISS